MYQPFSIDLKTMKKQRQDVDVVQFLFDFETRVLSLFVRKFWVVQSSHLFLRSFLGFSTLLFLILVLN
jgi:hypothetical protein